MPHSKASHYTCIIDDKSLSEFAVNYTLCFMLKFDASIHQITEV